LETGLRNFESRRPLVSCGNGRREITATAEHMNMGDQGGVR
jgi:hypothetical protein